ncbi:uncharacterized protein At1g43920, Chloroplastic-like [Medicago truncatula]|uniref:uncharacterized protein At1g43920, Chloroplastic-like n=1 Tax=Medicago truncatula TaxID=3880 RepID=UPI000236574C|nr:uncharacterized protein At1g43920, Chloroplastic-like [Medicago truncatula]
MKSVGNINTSNPNRSYSTASSSNVTRRGAKCFCGYHTVLLTCKQRPTAGRQFWRCPLWMTQQKCRKFIWLDESGYENINEDEDLQTRSDVGVVDLVKELVEDAHKNKEKTKNNKKKLNLMKKRGNILLALLLIMSL